MTEWGMGLLVAFIALGATDRLTWRQSGRVAFVLTVIVIVVVVAKYSSTTPTDKYVRSLDATVYATGNPASDQVPSLENLTGVQAATWANTDHSDVNLGTGGSSDGGGN
jgi:hypothetical protein